MSQHSPFELIKKNYRIEYKKKFFNRPSTDHLSFSFTFEKRETSENNESHQVIGHKKAEEELT